MPSRTASNSRAKASGRGSSVELARWLARVDTDEYNRLSQTRNRFISVELMVLGFDLGNLSTSSLWQHECPAPSLPRCAFAWRRGRRQCKWYKPCHAYPNPLRCRRRYENQQSSPRCRYVQRFHIRRNTVRTQVCLVYVPRRYKHRESLLVTEGPCLAPEVRVAMRH